MMRLMIRQKVAKLIEEIVGKEVYLEHPANPDFGDYATNIALKMKIGPKTIVEKLRGNPMFEKVEVAGAGFINIFLSKKILAEELSEIIQQGDQYGDLKVGAGKKVQVEFISANPTGPLTVGNARGGPFGDVLANILRKAGFETEKAYYVNDYGAQVLTLGHSVLKDEEAAYRGEYIDKLNKENKETDVYKTGQWAAKKIIEDYLKTTTKRMGIHYDTWFLESEMHKSGWVEKTLELLKEKDLIYEQDGAQWFKAKQFGDYRDRVVVKKKGQKTYLAGDIAYHRQKFEKSKFDKVINIWGADHHGDVLGLMAGVDALGYQGKLEIILLQFVTLLEKGAKKRMSKRAGVYVLMDELLNDVGKDAVRFMFLQKSPDTHLNFDIALAKEQSKNNPVYYVQYSYARICSIFKKILPAMMDGEMNFNLFALLTRPAELNLVRQLNKFSEIIEDTAKDYQVQRLPQYAVELAGDFHKFYEQCRVIGEENTDLSQARLILVKATQIILKNAMTLMGVSVLEKM